MALSGRRTVVARPKLGRKVRGFAKANVNHARRDRERSRSPRAATRPEGTQSPPAAAASSSERRGEDGTQSGEDEDEDEDANKEDDAPSLSDVGSTSYLIGKGRVIVRMREMWLPLRTVIEAGCTYTRLQDVPDQQLPLYEMYEDILALAPLIPDIIREEGASSIITVARLLDKGRSGARSSDVSSMKDKMGRWAYKFDVPINPADRHLMGFNNAAAGRLLCPVNFDFKNPSVCLGLQNGTTKLGVYDLPAFLWKGEAYDKTNMFEGFLRGELLILAYKHIFLGPTTACGGEQRNTRPGNAAANGISFVSIYSLAYTATLVRFVLSDQSALTGGGKEKGRWSYKRFYKAIINISERMTDEEKTELLEFWNDLIFSGIDDSDDEDEDADDPDATPSIGKLMCNRELD